MSGQGANGDLLLHGANVLTFDTPSHAEAVLLSNGRISRVGSSEELLRTAGHGVTRMNLEGRTILPGFNDNHIHVIIMGDRMSSLNLDGMSEQQILSALRERFGNVAKSTVIYAFGWDFTTVPAPHRKALDRIFPDNPVYLAQFSGHGAWVNSVALGKMGIRCREDCTGKGVGEVLLDESGEPSDVLREAFGNPWVRRVFMRRWLSRKTIRSALTAALPALAAAGITSVQDNTWFPPAIGVLREFRDQGRLTARFSCWKYGLIPAFAWWMNLLRHDEEWFHRGPWKYMADGAFSSHSAWLDEPYVDEPAGSGNGLPAGKLYELFEPHVKRRRQIACHAIGDRAVASICDAVERLAERYPWTPELGLRIEHAQLIRREDFPRLRKLGIFIAAQPCALVSPEKDVKLLGAERAERAYPFRSLIDEGIPLSFGSDFPGEGLFEPLHGIHLAVNRDGPERITAEEAFRAYTAGSARVEGREETKGTIAAGKLADLTVLSEDPLACAPGKIRDIRVELTVTGGRIVYRNPACPSLLPT